jgi:hypothetical protein
MEIKKFEVFINFAELKAHGRQIAVIFNLKKLNKMHILYNYICYTKNRFLLANTINSY